MEDENCASTFEHLRGSLACRFMTSSESVWGSGAARVHCWSGTQSSFEGAERAFCHSLDTTLSSTGTWSKRFCFYLFISGRSVAVATSILSLSLSLPPFCELGWSAGHGKASLNTQQRRPSVFDVRNRQNLVRLQIKTHHEEVQKLTYAMNLIFLPALILPYDFRLSWAKWLKIPFTIRGCCAWFRKTK